jgi:hypothetical protein
MLLIFPCIARGEDVARCFNVREMVKTEDGRYLVDAVSHCSREYNAVYVMVSFADSRGNHLDDGVWAIYWCRPARREVHEFQIPPGAVGFTNVAVRQITTDSEVALKRTSLSKSLASGPAEAR